MFPIRDVYKQCGHHWRQREPEDSHIPHFPRTPVKHRCPAQQLSRFPVKLADRLLVGLLSLRRAAASHRLRGDVGDTIWWREREKWGARKFITFQQATNLPGVLRVACYFFSCLTRINLQRFTTKTVFVKNICQFLLAKQSLRASKMATRNTSSSDALLGLSSAYVACDWSPVATPVLLLVDFCCLSRTLGWLFPGELPKWLDCQEKLKEQITVFLGITFYKNKNSTFESYMK